MNDNFYKSVFSVPKLDCPCEENLIRMKLDSLDSIVSLDFDLPGRTLSVTHTGDVRPVEIRLETLGLGVQLLETIQHERETSTDESRRQRKVLWTVLVINLAFFLLEVSTGFISRSMGLVADSLDMLADALVYGMSLIVVGATLLRKKRVALLSGYIQILLAICGLGEVIRRFAGFETPPDFRLMIWISILALIANTVSLWLLQRTKSNEAHIRASVIFSANDVIFNLGVMLAGSLVWWLNSSIPDLIIGIIVFLIVIRGAMRILKLAK